MADLNYGEGLPMKKNRFLSSWVILILLAFAFTGKASAASLYFAVPTEVVTVNITEQGTMAIDYLIDFDNTKGGAVIDYVDIGLPNQSYVLSSITADVDGKALSDIQKGDPQYIATGVTLGLGSQAIQPGSKGRLHLVVGQVGNVLYPYSDSAKPDYVSFEFVINNFGSQYVTGATDLTLSLRLPKGIQPDEPVYFPPANGWTGSSAPNGTLDDQGHVIYTWHTAASNPYTGYKFGAAFPAKYIPPSAIGLAITPTVAPAPVTSSNSSSNSSSASTSSGGGVDPMVVIIVIGFIVYGIYKWAVYSERMSYDAPRIAVEGLGVKRGLTAVEAAVLLEKPVDKILSMILFSVIRKGAASIVSQDPLQLEAVSPAPADLRSYETDFLNAINPVGMDPAKLQSLMVSLINQVRGSMDGFSRAETETYYRDILAKAWAEVEAAGTPEVKSQVFDEKMDWTLMDDSFDQRTRSVFSDMPVIFPHWWGRYDPTF